MFMHPTLFLPSFVYRYHIIPKVSAIHYLLHHVITILQLCTYLQLHYYSSEPLFKWPVSPRNHLSISPLVRVAQSFLKNNLCSLSLNISSSDLVVLYLLNSVISGSLSPRYGVSSGCGWRNGLQYGG